MAVLAAGPTSDAQSLHQSALRVLADPENPRRVHMAAYALRELMDAFEKAAGFVHQPREWKNEIAQLKKAWLVAQQSFGTEIDDSPFGGFTKILENFFAKLDDTPPRRELAANTLEALDPSSKEAPPAVRLARATEWMTFRKTFNDVLHQNVHSTHVEFSGTVQGFERFLLDWLRPQTFADFDEIDALLKEASSS